MAELPPMSKRPRKMIAEFSNMETLMWVGVALLAHAVVIGATSVGFIRDSIDPAAAAARKMAEANAVAVEAAAATQPASAPAVADGSPAPSPAAAAVAPGTEINEAKALDDRKDSKMVQKITEAAKPADIPKKPANSGIDLDESLSPAK